MRILNARPGAIWCCVALFILSAAGLNADPTAYDVTQQGLLGTIDLATGLITPIGYLGVGPGGWVWPAVHYLLPRTRMVTQTAYIG